MRSARRKCPHWIQVSRSNITWRSYSACRVGPSSDSMGSIRQSGHNRKFPLMGVDLDGLLKDKLGKRISQMLAGPATEFSQRLLLGYQFAGAACVDLHPERSFLMLAIALESVVLGKENKSELTYQLASRVAHTAETDFGGLKVMSIPPARPPPAPSGRSHAPLRGWRPSINAMKSGPSIVSPSMPSMASVSGLESHWPGAWAGSPSGVK